MRSRCGRRRARVDNGLVPSLKLAILIGGVLLTAGCLDNVEHPGAVYDKANRGSNGDFVIADTQGSGGVTLPFQMTYVSTTDRPSQVEPVREYVYRFKWLGADSKWHFSGWKSLGKNPDGSAVCQLTIRPSEVPELGANWSTCICETSAIFKTLDGKSERIQDIPILVKVAASGSGS